MQELYHQLLRLLLLILLFVLLLLLFLLLLLLPVLFTLLLFFLVLLLFLLLLFVLLLLFFLLLLLLLLFVLWSFFFLFHYYDYYSEYALGGSLYKREILASRFLSACRRKPQWQSVSAFFQRPVAGRIRWKLPGPGCVSRQRRVVLLGYSCRAL